MPAKQDSEFKNLNILRYNDFEYIKERFFHG